MKIIFQGIKYFIKDPLQFVENLWTDVKKDLHAKNYNSKYHLVWCAGLPKSGTTLIEKIFEQLPYVALKNSPIRLFESGKLDHDHGITENIFINAPKAKYSFVKTHTHYKAYYENIAKKFNVRILISLRDLRDAMISRYYHIINDKTHFAHSAIKDLSFEDGFLLSLTLTQTKNSEVPIEYYYNWILDWINVSSKKDIPIFWFENYKLDPKNYIKKILDYVNFEEFSSDDIFMKISNQKNFKKNLQANLQLYGRKSSTFRKGEIGEWKDLLNEKVYSSFLSLLPGSIDKVAWKEK